MIGQASQMHANKTIRNYLINEPHSIEIDLSKQYFNLLDRHSSLVMCSPEQTYIPNGQGLLT